MPSPSTLLDADRPDTVRLTVAEATELGEGALMRVGYGGEDARIIVDQLVDNALCGYRFAGLPRLLAMTRGQVRDYGFLFWVLDPEITERAFRERERRRKEGIVIERKVVETLRAL